MTKVLIADDHAIVRAGLHRLLDEAADIEVVGEATTCPEVLQKARETEPDIVVLDISMPGRGGLDTLKELKRWRPSLKVLIFSMHAERQFAVRFLREGADGYLNKQSAPGQLLDAVRRIDQGGKHISTELAEALAQHFGPDSNRPAHERLSDREFQVMQGIASGRTVSEISEDLCLSIKTISTYRSRVLEKIGLENNAQIMKYALDEGLVESA